MSPVVMHGTTRRARGDVPVFPVSLPNGVARRTTGEAPRAGMPKSKSPVPAKARQTRGQTPPPGSKCGLASPRRTPHGKSAARTPALPRGKRRATSPIATRATPNARAPQVRGRLSVVNVFAPPAAARPRGGGGGGGGHSALQKYSFPQEDSSDEPWASPDSSMSQSPGHGLRSAPEGSGSPAPLRSLLSLKSFSTYPEYESASESDTAPTSPASPTVRSRPPSAPPSCFRRTPSNKRVSFGIAMEDVSELTPGPQFRPEEVVSEFTFRAHPHHAAPKPVPDNERMAAMRDPYEEAEFAMHAALQTGHARDREGPAA